MTSSRLAPRRSWSRTPAPAAARRTRSAGASASSSTTHARSPASSPVGAATHSRFTRSSQLEPRPHRPGVLRGHPHPAEQHQRPPLLRQPRAPRSPRLHLLAPLASHTNRRSAAVTRHHQPPKPRSRFSGDPYSRRWTGLQPPVSSCPPDRRSRARRRSSCPASLITPTVRCVSSAGLSCCWYGRRCRRCCGTWRTRPGSRPGSCSTASGPGSGPGRTRRHWIGTRSQRTHTAG